MINHHQYKLCREESGILRMVVASVSCCPDCGDNMRVRDSRIRCFIDEDGQKCLLRHRRLMCRKCRKIHSELPDFIMPQKRYITGVILKASFSDTSNQNRQVCAAENSTIHKWKIEITCRAWVIFLFLLNCCCIFGNGAVVAIITKILSHMLETLTEHFPDQLPNRHSDICTAQGYYRETLIWLYCFEPGIYFNT